MKKIPSLFVCNYPEKICTREVTPGCEWVLNGEGKATRKWDGTAVMVKDGKVYARYDAKKGKVAPAGAIPCEPQPNPVTGHHPHWVLADRPEDKWIRAAASIRQHEDGTYEACGPKINGNPEGLIEHLLLPHGEAVLDVERSYDGIKAYLEANDMEGIVFHHPDGRMCKIRKDHFGLKRNPSNKC